MTDKMRESERNPYYRERKRELNHQLYERVQSELAVFHKEMLGKTPEEIYEAAHEIAAKHEIAAAFAHIDFAPVSEEWRERGCLPEGGLKGLIGDFRKYMVKTERILSGQER